MADNVQGREVSFNLAIADTSKIPAEAVNWFHFTMSAGEVQMLMGCIDILSAHNHGMALAGWT